MDFFYIIKEINDTDEQLHLKASLRADEPSGVEASQEQDLVSRLI